MNGKYFLDTNIIVYSFESSSRKAVKARELIQVALKNASGIISYQVIQEFSNVALKKFASPMKPDDLKLYARQVLFPLCEVFPSFSFYETACYIHRKHGFSYYDSLIVTAALVSDCDVLYSEDLQDQYGVDSKLKIINPFV